MSDRVSESPEKAIVADRLMSEGLEAGVFIMVFDTRHDMVEAAENMRVGAEFRKAIAEQRGVPVEEIRMAPPQGGN